MKFFKPLIFGSVIISLAAVLGLGVNQPISAQNATQVCEQIQVVDPDATCDPAGSQTALDTTAEKVFNVLSYIIGTISVIVILIGGIMYAASGGDPQNTKRAKDAILYAVIGVVIALLAQAMVKFVIGGVG